MNIALLGYGSMGKSIHRIALERGHIVSAIIDPNAPEANFREIIPEALLGINLVLDFSHGFAVQKNIKICLKSEVSLLVGTTGWYEKLPEIRKQIESGKIGFLWSSNFSLGIHLYFRIIAETAKLIGAFDEYDIWGHEIHHCNKSDSPSGTTKTLEKILLENIPRKKSIVEEKLDRRREDDEIHFSSVRGGVVNFAHTIGFDSAADKILITHEARNRDGYALGAVKAAEWLQGKKGYFEMEDYLREILNFKL
ncbi:4-hydroxy-tetrahydrodipicolinate reductase [Candidatus Peregrinibacteria bacterium]|nr:4-hydroxy-tetrahydrodipicolinate reductase [Candidatus Peregrinibacteria bacterium]